MVSSLPGSRLPPERRGPLHHSKIARRDVRQCRRRLCQVFRKSIPVMDLPPERQVLRLTLWESGVVKHNLCPRSLFHKLESRDGIKARLPINHPPRLYDPLVRHKFKMSSDDVPAKYEKLPAHFWADFRRHRAQRFSRLHFRAPLRHRIKLFGLRQRLKTRFLLALKLFTWWIAASE